MKVSASNSSIVNRQNLGSLIICAVFVFIAVMTLYDTSHYSDIDSKVFPRACAILLLFFSLITMVWELIKPTEVDGFGTGSWWRRVLLVGTMLIACIAMPYVTFIPAACIAFMGGLIAAMHNRWSYRTFSLFIVVGILIVISFYAIFKYALYVPLP